MGKVITGIRGLRTGSRIKRAQAHRMLKQSQRKPVLPERLRQSIQHPNNDRVGICVSGMSVQSKEDILRRRARRAKALALRGEAVVVARIGCNISRTIAKDNREDSLRERKLPHNVYFKPAEKRQVIYESIDAAKRVSNRFLD